MERLKVLTQVGLQAVDKTSATTLAKSGWDPQPGSRLRIALVFSVCAISPPLLAHSGHSSAKAWSVCHDKQISQSCSYTNKSKDVYRGTCQSMSDQLMCVRNQPIEKAN